MKMLRVLFAGLLLGPACSSSPAPTADGGPDGGPDGGVMLGDAGDAGFPDSGGSSLLDLGGACASASACRSGLCSRDGGGHCCAQSCAATDPVCGAVDCDSVGACIYPPPTTDCGSPACAEGAESLPTCDGLGHCRALAAEPCAGNFACAEGGLACGTSCAGDGGCVPSAICVGGSCLPKGRTGACESGADCASGECRGGSCCATPCRADGGDALCGASRCAADTGACLYADSGLPCGSPSARSCPAGQPTALASQYCDGQGGCGPSSAEVCPQSFVCEAASPAQCYASCAGVGNAACAPGSACDGNLCCPAVVAGATVAVDAYAGDDARCCGQAGTPCRTLGHAMALIAASRAAGVRLDVANTDPNANGWNSPLERYPVHLGWGVQLRTNLSFNSARNTLFEVYRFSDEPEDAGAVVLAGNGGPIQLGFDTQGTSTTSTAVAVAPDAGAGGELIISNALMIATDTVATVGANGRLVFGPDFVGITAQVGQPYGRLSYATGLRCRGAPGAPARIADTADGGDPALQFAGYPQVLFMESATDVEIEADDDCQIQLTQNPILGFCSTQSAYGLGIPFEQDGLRANGTARVQLAGSGYDTAGFSCFSRNCVSLSASPEGSPDVDLFQLELSSCRCAGARVQGGRLTLDSDLVAQGHFGVLLLDGGSLVFGDDAGATTVDVTPSAVPSRQPAAGSPYIYTGSYFVNAVFGGSYCPQDLPGLGGADPAVSILNASGQPVSVGSAQIGQTPGAVWTCADPRLDRCTCQSDPLLGGSPCAAPTGGVPDQSGEVGLFSTATPFVP